MPNDETIKVPLEISDRNNEWNKMALSLKRDESASPETDALRPSDPDPRKMEAALRFIAAQTDLFFAECSQAEAIIERVKEALAVSASVAAGPQEATYTPSCMVCGFQRPFRMSSIEHPEHGVCFPCADAVDALRRIVALDFKKTEQGGDDFYSGPDRFVRAWTIANDALKGTRE